MKSSPKRSESCHPGPLEINVGGTPTDEPQIVGFNRPRTPQDGWTAELYAKHHLGTNPSLAQIEPVAIELLSDVETVIEGAELVLGQRIGAATLKDSLLGKILHAPVPGRTKFGLLLLQSAVR